MVSNGPGWILSDPREVVIKAAKDLHATILATKMKKITHADQTKRNVISNIFFLYCSSGFPVIIVTIFMSAR